MGGGRVRLADLLRDTPWDGSILFRREDMQWRRAKGRLMALQLGALRDALIDAGAKQEKADKAAEELAGYETAWPTSTPD